MKKFLLYFWPFAISYLLLASPALAASNDLLCAYCPELCGGQSGNPISSGEYFYCRPGPTGSNTFTLCKNQNCSVYEKYAYDSQQLYLIEDTSWATAAGPVRCSDSGQLAYYRTYGQGTDPMPWISRNLAQGDCFNRSGTVVGYEKGTNRQCPTPFSGPTSGVMCLTYEGCIMLPNGVWTENGLILTIGGGGGAGENYYFDRNRGWIGFDRGGGVSGAFITDPIGTGAAPENCLKIAQGAAFGACQAEQPFPGGAETKGESFTVRVTSCFGPADPAEAVDGLLKATKLDFPNNQQIAAELEWPLDNLKPAGYTPQVLERTALGKITYDVCEEGTTNWYTVEKEVEFKTPAWLEKMATESKELASWLVPGGGQGQVAGEQTQNLPPNSTPLLAQAGPMVSITSLSCSASNWQVNCSVNIDATPGTGHVWVTANGKFLGINKTNYGLVYYYDASVSPGTNSFTVNVNVINHDRQPKPEDNASCTIQFDANGNGSCSAGGGMPRPTPTPRICQKYIPQGGSVSPEIVCVGGSCQIKSLPRSSFITQIIDGVAQTICPGKTFLVTPKVRTPFALSADTFLREQTLSVFKVSGPAAEEAFEFEHALEDARHEFTASPPSLDSSETEIYGQRGVKDAYEWVQKALTPK